MSGELRVFSPSATETFGKCPRRWALSRAGIKPRIIAYPELCAVLGDGFSESMRLYNTQLINGVYQPSLPEIVAAGNRVMSERLAADIEAGRRIHEKDVAFADLLPLKLDRAVQLYMRQNPLKGWKLLNAELSFPNFGNCRIDLLAEDSVGRAVFDYKVKVKLDSKWEDAEFEKHSRSQQRFHYQWAAGVKRFFIILVVLGPKPYVKVSAPYGDSQYFDSGLWMFDSQSLWAYMREMRNALEAGEPFSNIPGAPIHQDQYGPCEYEDACLVHALDPAAINTQYVQIERRPLVHK